MYQIAYWYKIIDSDNFLLPTDYTKYQLNSFYPKLVEAFVRLQSEWVNSFPQHVLGINTQNNAKESC